MSVPDQFLCSITCEVMQDPVIIAPCGHTFDRRALMCSLSVSNDRSLCPLCRGEIVSLAPSRALKELIDAWCAVRQESLRRGSTSGDLPSRARDQTTRALSVDVDSPPAGFEKSESDSPSNSGRVHHNFGESKVPLHVSPLNRRRSQQPQLTEDRPRSHYHSSHDDRRRSHQPNSPDDRRLSQSHYSPGSDSPGSAARHSPPSHVGSPCDQKRAYSIHGHLDSFTFGLPLSRGESACSPNSPNSPHSPALLDDDFNIKILEEQLRLLEEVGRRNSPVWNQINNRLIELRNRSGTTSSDLSESRNLSNSTPPTHRRSVATSRQGSCCIDPAEWGTTVAIDTHGRQSYLRARAESLDDANLSDGYALAVHQLRKEEVVWSSSSATRGSPCDGFSGFAKTFKRFVKLLPWSNCKMPREDFLKAYRKAIDASVVAPRGHAEPVYIALLLWNRDPITTDQMGRILELKSLPSTLSTFNHLLDDDINHAKCPTTCAGRRYCDGQWCLTVEKACATARQRADEDAEALRQARVNWQSKKTTDEGNTETRTTKKRDKVAAFFTSKSNRTTSFS